MPGHHHGLGRKGLLRGSPCHHGHAQDRGGGSDGRHGEQWPDRWRRRHSCGRCRAAQHGAWMHGAAASTHGRATLQWTVGDTQFMFDVRRHDIMHGMQLRPAPLVAPLAARGADAPAGRHAVLSTMWHPESAWQGSSDVVGYEEPQLRSRQLAPCLWGAGPPAHASRATRTRKPGHPHTQAAPRPRSPLKNGSLSPPTGRENATSSNCFCIWPRPDTGAGRAAL